MNLENTFLGPRSIQVCHFRSKTPLTSVDCLRGLSIRIQRGHWQPCVPRRPAKPLATAPASCSAPLRRTPAPLPPAPADLGSPPSSPLSQCGARRRAAYGLRVGGPPPPRVPSPMPATIDSSSPMKHSSIPRTHSSAPVAPALAARSAAPAAHRAARPPTPPCVDPASESEHEGEKGASQRGSQRPRWIGCGGPRRQSTLVRCILDLK
ncbi:hypothetical protein PVAP13_5NG208343 [Panicum virgatum]|uniref:Uncharacterized protein n=1 Tax=Panicum virgatum TaxID=38727 RepID=A0A8T0RSR4_PANVG|nr:hypothetical protein PVAP13_5NG208343 [Panicum virgatum]